MPKYPHILSEIARTPWAITPAALRGIVSAAEGKLDARDYPTFHGAEPGKQLEISAMLGEKQGGARLSSVRDGLGILQINGPIVPRADAFTDMSGLTSVDRLSAEFSALAADPGVRHILLVLDSPGGAITGISEFASQVDAAAKPVTAYIYGMAASAAYWIASAADEILAGDTAMTGSIGVVMTLYKGDEDEIEIVSSQSPLKRPDPENEEHLGDLQREVDGLADVFVQTVARNRSTTPAAVIEKFGRGGMLLPTEAVRVGMIDGQSTLADYLGELITGTPRKKIDSNEDLDFDNPAARVGKEGKSASSNREETKMNLTEMLKEHPELAAELDAIKASALAEGKAAGAAAAVADLNKRNAQASTILASDAYSATIKGFAAGVLSGTKSAEQLETAVAVFDAMKAEREMDGAKADSKNAPATPPQKTEPLSTDGVLRTPADIDAAAAAMKAGR